MANFQYSISGILKQMQYTSSMDRNTIQSYKSVGEIKQHFYLEPIITTIGELIEFINQPDEGERYWRGLNDGSFTMVAKSYVDFCQKELFNISDYNKYLQRIWDTAKADTSLEDIHKHQTQDREHSQYTPLWALTFIQHYATGTPLIDWTNNLWSALYFAWSGAKPSPRTSHKLSDYIQLNFFYNSVRTIYSFDTKSGAPNSEQLVLLLRAEQSNEELEQLRTLSKDRIITIDSYDSYKWLHNGTYQHTGMSCQNDRSNKQNGFFILHLEDSETLEEKWNRIFKEYTSQNRDRYDAVDKMQLHKVLIHKSLVPYIECLLKEYWGDDLSNELLPKRCIFGYDPCQITRHIIEKAQTKE